MVRYRALFKKERFKPEDLDDDMDLKQAMAILKAKKSAKSSRLLKDGSAGAIGARCLNIVNTIDSNCELEKFK